MVRARFFALPICVAITVAAASPADAQAPRRTEPITSIDEKTNGLKKIDGFFPLYWDEAAGRLWLEIPKLDTEVLYSTGLATGLGSNDIGLDRGILTGSRIVKFERVGPRVLMVQPNYQFRALTTSAAEARTVRDAFARSVLWGFSIAAATGDRLLVDFTEYLVRDGNDMAGRLRPGTYRFDSNRSSVYMPMTLGFPQEHRDRSRADVRSAAGRGRRSGRRRGRRARRRRWGVPRGRRQRRRQRGIRQHPHPSFHRRAAGRQLQNAPLRSALGLRRPRVRELRRPSRAADDRARSSGATAFRRRIRRRRSASRSNRSFITSIPARRSRSDPRCSKARDGGIRHSKPRAIATPSASSCCRKASARSTFATTSSTGCTARLAAGAPAARCRSAHR